MIILGIETSCDETAASVIEVKNDKVKVLSNVISSQIEIHKKYGGVVPEVAAREHVLNILPVVNEALVEAEVNPPNPLYQGGARYSAPLTRGGRGVDAIAVAVGPGLVTSLIVGVETAKTLAYAWQIPTIAVNHIEGHIYSNFIADQNIKFPALILTVSGGHTNIVLMKGHGKLQVIGETLDDAAGEAFDKAAQLMNLGYPGGPVISQWSEKFKTQSTEHKNQTKHKAQNTKQITLPRPIIQKPGFDFSFSGLKTALLYELQKDKKWRKRIPEYCHEFQQAIVDVLIFKTIKAAEKYKIRSVLLSGGVSANKELRSQLETAVKTKLNKAGFYMPELKYTTDNATMIATAGYYKAKRKKFTPWQKLKVDSNLELT